jgi:hypothetical protein
MIGGRENGSVRRPSPLPSLSSPRARRSSNRRVLTTATLGIAQAIAAMSWGNGVGVAVGATTFGAGVALASSSSLSSSASPPPRALRRCAQALSAYALVLLLVHLASMPDPSIAAFPSACPPGLQGRHGCSRVAADGSSHRPPAPPLDAPFRARALLSDVEGVLLQWLEDQPRRVTVLRHVKPGEAGPDGEDNKRGFLHVRAVTPLLGFADDFFVSWRCTLLGEAVVELQGQLRLGVGDAGVNVRRNAAVLGHLKGAELPTAAWCR